MLKYPSIHPSISSETTYPSQGRRGSRAHPGGSGHKAGNIPGQGANPSQVLTYIFINIFNDYKMKTLTAVLSAIFTLQSRPSGGAGPANASPEMKGQAVWRDLLQGCGSPPCPRPRLGGWWHHTQIRALCLLAIFGKCLTKKKRICFFS